MIIETDNDKVLDLIQMFQEDNKKVIYKVLDQFDGDVSIAFRQKGEIGVIFKFSKENDSGLSYVVGTSKEILKFLKENPLGKTKPEIEMLLKSVETIINK